MKTLSCSSLFIILLVGSLSASLEAQTATVIRDTEAIQHVGQYVTIEGTVAVVFTPKHGNTFLNFGDPYPNQIFTGWIPNDSVLAGDPSLSSLEGKTVKITGKIDLYHGKPEIKIISKDQLVSE